jgi:hypothetical protein
MPTPLSPKEFDEMPYAQEHTGYRHGDWRIYLHEGKCQDWDNCTEFAFITLPCGHTFDAGHRASNCTKPEDRLHRCWVVEGKFPNASLTKNGLTCAAGAGSILCHCGWHGFLQNGVLTP